MTPRVSGSLHSCPSMRSAPVPRGSSTTAATSSRRGVRSMRGGVKSSRFAHQAGEQQPEHLLFVMRERLGAVALQRADHIAGENHLRGAEDNVGGQLWIEIARHL